MAPRGPPAGNRLPRPGRSGAAAAELVSWPPRTFASGNGMRVWGFSFYLRISLQTVPFDPRPRFRRTGSG
jgi:pPIWI_RE module N-terminal domain